MSDIANLNKALSKIFRALAESAAKEISNLVQDNYATLCLELYQSKGEINRLKRSLALAESTRETIHNVTYSQRNGSDMEYEDEQILDYREPDVTAASSATGIKVLVPMATGTKSMTSVGPQTPASTLNKLKTHVTRFPIGESPKVEQCPPPASAQGGAPPSPHPSPSTPPPPGSPHSLDSGAPPHSPSSSHLHPPPTQQHPPNNQNNSQTHNSDSSPSEYEGNLSSWGTVATSATGIQVLVPVGADIMKSQTSVGPQTTVASNKLKTHVTCFPIGEAPKVEQCTTCCDLYHCPFCRPSVFKPTEYHRIIPHLQSHLHSAIRTDEFVICKCRLTCRDPPHFHCCYCQNIQIRRSGIVKHISDCQKLSKRRPPPASAQGGPPPSPHPSPSPPPGSPHPLDSGAPTHSPSSSHPHPPPTQQHPPNNQNTSQTLNSDSSPSLLPRHVSPTQSTGSSPCQPSEANQTLEEVHGMDLELKSVTLEPLSRPPTTHYMEASPTLCPSPSSLPLLHVDEIPPLPLHPSPPNVPAQETKNMPPQSTGGTVASKQFKEDRAKERKSMMMMKMMCDFCGIVLRRKNYKVHMMRRHEEEFKAMEQEEAWLKEREFKLPKVLSPCHICGMHLQKCNHKKHLQRWHEEEFNLDACRITLKKGINHTRCHRCGVLVKTQNLRKHMKTKHQEKMSVASYQEALNLFVADREPLMAESSQASSPSTTVNSAD